MVFGEKLGNEELKAEKQQDLPKISDLEDISIGPKGSDVILAINDGYSESEKQRTVIASNIPNNPEYQSGLTRLKQGLEQEYFGLHQENQRNESKLREQYIKILQGCFGKDCPSYDTFEKEYSKVEALPDTNFIENLKNLDHPLETPLLEPLDIILLLATFSTILGKVGLNVLSKGCRLMVDKTGKIMLQTEAGTKILEAKEIGGKAIQSIFEKYKGKIQGFKETFEPHGVTTEGFSIKVPKNEFKPGNIARAESMGEGADFVDGAFNKLVNATMFRNSEGLIGNKEFMFKIEDLAKDINIKDFLNEGKLDLFEGVIDRIEDFIVHRGGEIAQDKFLQEGTRVALRRISDTMVEAAKQTKSQAAQEFTKENVNRIKILYTQIGIR
ncbi:MAG: hypothetical protein PHS92_03930 [Candidatus Gracilibacteria bacterium]|nr:hypothetical protein [Candidatus Gracilibacteria bacterium]